MPNPSLAVTAKTLILPQAMGNLHYAGETYTAFWLVPQINPLVLPEGFLTENTILPAGVSRNWQENALKHLRAIAASTATKGKFYNEFGYSHVYKKMIKRLMQRHPIDKEKLQRLQKTLLDIQQRFAGFGFWQNMTSLLVVFMGDLDYIVGIVKDTHSGYGLTLGEQQVGRLEQPDPTVDYLSLEDLSLPDFYPIFHNHESFCVRREVNEIKSLITHPLDTNLFALTMSAARSLRMFEFRQQLDVDLSHPTIWLPDLTVVHCRPAAARHFGSYSFLPTGLFSPDFDDYQQLIINNDRLEQDLYRTLAEENERTQAYFADGAWNWSFFPIIEFDEFLEFFGGAFLSSLQQQLSSSLPKTWIHSPRQLRNEDQLFEKLRNQEEGSFVQCITISPELEVILDVISYNSILKVQFLKENPPDQFITLMQSFSSEDDQLSMQLETLTMSEELSGFADASLRDNLTGLSIDCRNLQSAYGCKLTLLLENTDLTFPHCAINTHSFSR